MAYILKQKEIYKISYISEIITVDWISNLF